MDPAWIIDEAPAGALISSSSLLHLNVPELEPRGDVSEAWRPSPTAISIRAGPKLEVWRLLLDLQAELSSELGLWIHHLLEGNVLESGATTSV